MTQAWKWKWKSRTSKSIKPKSHRHQNIHGFHFNAVLSSWMGDRHPCWFQYSSRTYKMCVSVLYRLYYCWHWWCVPFCTKGHCDDDNDNNHNTNITNDDDNHLKIIIKLQTIWAIWNAIPKKWYAFPHWNAEIENVREIMTSIALQLLSVSESSVIAHTFWSYHYSSHLNCKWFHHIGWYSVTLSLVWMLVLY